MRKRACYSQEALSKLAMVSVDRIGKMETDAAYEVKFDVEGS